MIMRKAAGIPLALASIGAVLVAVGCATDRGTHQFEPVPAAKVHSRELEPASPKSATELLKSAQEAFAAANAAQEQGDRDAALKHYNRMLECLVQANLDPGVFYNLRGEFQRILGDSGQNSELFDQNRLREFAESEYPGNVFGDLPIEFPISERVLQEIYEIQHAYPKNFQGGMNRSARYLPWIREEFRKAGLPQDLVWLAQVESQFSPKVVSRAGAAGMWQFMRATAHRYDLRCDEYVDERFSWRKSTIAAIAYLRDLNNQFAGAWPLAISAYNMGEGGMQRVLAAAGDERNLWKLLDSPAATQGMQEETRKFYAKLLGTIIVAKNPDRFGFRMNPQPPEQTIEVAVKGSYSLSALDKACGLPGGTLRELNPDLVRGVTPPNDDYSLVAPLEASGKLAKALQEAPKNEATVHAAEAAPRSVPRSHTIRRGETLTSISQKYGVSPGALATANRIRSSHRLIAGRKLTIPGTSEVREGYREPTESSRESAGGARTGNAGIIHTVKKGDTISDIAKAQKVPVDKLLEWNSLDEHTTLKVGDKLRLSPLAEIQQKGEDRYHTVQTGDYPAKIAKLYGVNLDEFLKSNNLTKISKIQVGDKLRIPSGSSYVDDAPPAAPAAPAAPAQEKVTHTVAKGETASAIAQKYGVKTSDFLAWNKLTPKSVLRVGDKCVVYPAGHTTKAAAATAAVPSKPAATAPAPTQPETGKKISHVVSKGQNPTTIAHRYGVSLSDLFKWNGWDKNVVLDVGDRVIVYTK